MHSKPIDVTDDNSACGAIYRYVINSLPNDTEILEIGDETGEFGELLADRGHPVTVTTNSDPHSSTIATRNLTVIDSRAGLGSVTKTIGNTYGAVIVWLGDADLLPVLQAAKKLLVPDGVLLLVAKNSLHGSRRIATLAGFELPTGFKYSTFSTLTKSLTMAGFCIETAHSVVKEVLENDESGSSEIVPENVVDWVRHQPQAMDEEFILTCTPSSSISSEEVEITPLIPYPKVEDKFTESARLLRSEAIHGKLRETELERLRSRESELLRLANDLKMKEQIIRNDAQYKNDLEEKLAQATQKLDRTDFNNPKEKILKFIEKAKQKLKVR